MSQDIFSIDFVADGYVKAMQTQFSSLNSQATAAYDQTWENAKVNAAASGIWTDPAPVTVHSVDAVKLRALFVAWSDSLKGGFTPLDTSSAIVDHQYSRPAPHVAAAPIPVPTVVVGFNEGNGFWSVVPGDPNPIGHVEVEIRGVFVKVGNETPFGWQVAYRKAA